MSRERSRSGEHSDEDWLARRNGTSYGEASSKLTASAKLEDLPELNSALRHGEISGPKLTELGHAITRENEGRLVSAAKTDNEVIIRVDAEKLAGGEGIAEVVGGGSVPVSEVIGALFANAFVKVLATDGVDVTRVVHPGRGIPDLVRTAIFERDGSVCVRPGCGSSHRLQLHHYPADFNETQISGYSQQATVCKADHDLITYGGHRLTGGPGRWKWIPPP